VLTPWYHRKDRKFPSLLERAVFEALVERELEDRIYDIAFQPNVVLQDGPPEIKITWNIDFSFVERPTDRLVYCEAKGLVTEDYKLKLKMYRAKPPAPLEIWGGDWQKPLLLERIEP
jgi:hypothetical protein